MAISTFSPVTKTINAPSGQLNEDNFMEACLRFRERQAGVGVVFCPDEEKYFYNAYCLETKLLKELMSVEYEFLDEALEFINEEFSTWELEKFDKDSGCGSCAAK